LEQVSYVDGQYQTANAYGTDNHIYVRDRNLDSYNNCGGGGIVWSTAHLLSSDGSLFAEVGFMKDLKSDNQTKWFRIFSEWGPVNSGTEDWWTGTPTTRVFSTFRVSNTIGTGDWSLRFDDNADGSWNYTKVVTLGTDHGVAKGETGRRPEDGVNPAAADEQRTLLYRDSSGGWHPWVDNNANSAVELIPWWSPTWVAVDHFTVDQCGSQSC